MSHEHKGNYPKKHPSERNAKPALVDAIKKKAENNSLSCAAAHNISAELGETPAEVGFTMDLLEIQIIKCQLGLFGYTPQKKIVRPADSIDPSLNHVLESSTLEHRLSCKTAWEIADRLGKKRLEVSSACEALGIKISPCQLGAF